MPAINTTTSFEYLYIFVIIYSYSIGSSWIDCQPPYYQLSTSIHQYQRLRIIKHEHDYIMDNQKTYWPLSAIVVSHW